MKFSIKDFFSECNQFRRKLQIWTHLLNKSLMENFIFCAVLDTNNLYGYVMSKSLSTDEFKSIDPKKCDSTKYSSNSSKGCF